MRYRGKDFSDQDIRLIQKAISDDGHQGRAFLSRAACELLSWKRADGRLKDMACRVAMLQMQTDGLIILPSSRNQNAKIRREILKTLYCEPGLAIQCRVDELPGIELEIVKGLQISKLWNEWIDRYHYLGYSPLKGAQIRYLIRTKDQVLGCMGWCAAAWKTMPRDEFIGWSHEQRERQLERVINNSRYLIFPWVNVKGLASKALAMAAKRLPGDWQKQYGYEPVLLETFVEAQRFKGTCYKAANWTCVGETKGRGRYDRYNTVCKPIKSIWLYPLKKGFRGILCQ